MGSDLNFDANKVKPNSRPDPVPNGDYRVAITASEVKPTSTGTGKYLKLELTILDGECKGRKLFDQINVQNESKQAQDIGQGQLSAICHAVGVLQMRNSSQLHDRPMIVRTVIKQSPGYDPKNEIKGYKPVDGATPATTQAPAPATAATPANVPTWANKKTA